LGWRMVGAVGSGIMCAMTRWTSLAALVLACACGGAEPAGGGGPEPGIPAGGGTESGGETGTGGESGEPTCRSDAECEDAMSDQCPGGSTVFATCVDGTCRFEGCSSPIGTPCDDDPSTRFEDEDCPE